jgi:hypothetical protein
MKADLAAYSDYFYAASPSSSGLLTRGFTDFAGDGTDTFVVARSADAARWFTIADKAELGAFQG